MAGQIGQVQGLHVCRALGFAKLSEALQASNPGGIGKKKGVSEKPAMARKNHRKTIGKRSKNIENGVENSLSGADWLFRLPVSRNTILAEKIGQGF